MSNCCGCEVPLGVFANSEYPACWYKAATVTNDDREQSVTMTVVRKGWYTVAVSSNGADINDVASGEVGTAWVIAEIASGTVISANLGDTSTATFYDVNGDVFTVTPGAASTNGGNAAALLLRYVGSSKPSSVGYRNWVANMTGTAAAYGVNSRSAAFADGKTVNDVFAQVAAITAQDGVTYTTAEGVGSFATMSGLYSHWYFNTINVPTAGTYTLYAVGDDDTLIFIDGKQVHGYTGTIATYMETVELTAGDHDFIIFGNNSGGSISYVVMALYDSSGNFVAGTDSSWTYYRVTNCAEVTIPTVEQTSSCDVGNLTVTPTITAGNYGAAISARQTAYGYSASDALETHWSYRTDEPVWYRDVVFTFTVTNSNTCDITLYRPTSASELIYQTNTTGGIDAVIEYTDSVSSYVIGGGQTVTINVPVRIYMSQGGLNGQETCGTATFSPLVGNWTTDISGGVTFNTQTAWDAIGVRVADGQLNTTVLDTVSTESSETDGITWNLRIRTYTNNTCNTAMTYTLPFVFTLTKMIDSVTYTVTGLDASSTEGVYTLHNTGLLVNTEYTYNVVIKVPVSSALESSTLLDILKLAVSFDVSKIDMNSAWDAIPAAMMLQGMINKG